MWLKWLNSVQNARRGRASGLPVLYQKPALKTKFGERAFSYAWNSLPEYIQMDLNTNRFKKLLKTYLFASSFLNFLFRFIVCSIMKCPPVYCVGGQKKPI